MNEKISNIGHKGLGFVYINGLYLIVTTAYNSFVKMEKKIGQCRLRERKKEYLFF